MLRFEVRGQTIIRLDRETVVAGTTHWLKAKWCFDRSWRGLTKILYFKNGGEAKELLLTEQESCFIPWEVLAKPGKLYLYVEGYDQDKQCKACAKLMHKQQDLAIDILTNTKPVNVTEQLAPTPSLMEQLTAMYTTMQTEQTSLRQELESWQTVLEQATNILTHGPRINEDGYWEVWDIQTQEYQDTGVCAVGSGEGGGAGQDGADGITPHIGDNGNWYIDTTDTGVKAKGQDGADGKDATVTVGKVTTLAAGTNATVTNRGTAQNAILDFGIPKGEQGDTASVSALETRLQELETALEAHRNETTGDSLEGVHGVSISSSGIRWHQDEITGNGNGFFSFINAGGSGGGAGTTLRELNALHYLASDAGQITLTQDDDGTPYELEYLVFHSYVSAQSGNSLGVSFLGTNSGHWYSNFIIDTSQIYSNFYLVIEMKKIGNGTYQAHVSIVPDSESISTHHHITMPLDLDKIAGVRITGMFFSGDSLEVWGY